MCGASGRGFLVKANQVWSLDFPEPFIMPGSEISVSLHILTSHFFEIAAVVDEAQGAHQAPCQHFVHVKSCFSLATRAQML